MRKILIIAFVVVLTFLVILYFVINSDLKDLDKLKEPVRKVLYDRDSLLVYKETWGISSNHTVIRAEGACCGGEVSLYPPVFVEVAPDSSSVTIYSSSNSTDVINTRKLQVIKVTKQEMLILSRSKNKLLYKFLD
jgi:hypothetical protein